MPYSAVLHTTVGSSRCARMPGSACRWAAAGTETVSTGQIRRFAKTSIRLNPASRSNTLPQPNDAPISVPSGAPKDSEHNKPETATAIQLARRPGGPLSPPRAYIDGDTPAAIAQATIRAASSPPKLGAAEV